MEMTEQRLQAARAWATLWKKAAKVYRNQAIYYRGLWDKKAPYAAMLQNDNRRLREALDHIKRVTNDALTFQIAREALEDTDGNDAG